MHGFGPTILAHLPKEGRGASVRDLQDSFAQATLKVPSTPTIYKHLGELDRLGYIHSEQRGRHRIYWRLVDSVLDPAPLEAEA